MPPGSPLPMPTIINVFLLAAAGAIGTLLRAGCNAVSVRILGDSFPWGTLVVNVAGSFAFGAIYAVARSRAISTEQEVVLLVGLLGGFTTYSSYAFQSTEMLSNGRLAAALAYVVATNTIGVAAVWAGLRMFR